MRVLGIGDNVVDRYLHIGTMFPGGNSVNFCVYAVQSGAQSAYLGVFGNDGEAEHVQRVLREYGVDLSRSRHAPLPTNRCSVDLYDGDRDIGDDPNYDLFTEYPIVLAKDDYEYVKGFDVLHTNVYVHMEEQLPKLHGTGVPIVYDFSHLWTEEILERACPNVDIGFFSLGHMTDGEIDEFMRRIHAMGCSLVVGTMGKRGARVFNGRRFYEKPPYNLEGRMRDTLGAGDSFLTGFTLSYIAGRQNYRSIADSGVDLQLPQADIDDYEDRLIESSMARGNLLACRTCQVDAAFEHGAPILP